MKSIFLVSPSRGRTPLVHPVVISNQLVSLLARYGAVSFFHYPLKHEGIEGSAIRNRDFTSVAQPAR